MRLAHLALPLGLLVALVAILVLANPARYLESAAPAPEAVAFDRAILKPGHIELHIRNVGSGELAIAQVLIDDAYWQFEATPSGPLARFDSATLALDYPWVETEPMTITLLSGSGVRYAHTIDVPLATPEPEARSLGVYAVIGLLVGVLPIVAGMTFFPAMRGASTRWTHAVLAFTLGLLTFLLVETLGEGLELAGELPERYHGLVLFAGAALVALVGVLALDAALKGRGSRAGGQGPGASLAILIAVGIGLHNLGEGLVIGSAFALGALTLGTALIVGFALHNVTEGPAIVAPLARGGTLRPARFALLAAVSGLPTILGAWLGAFTSNGILPVVFFGLGAGAIAVVLVQVGGAMRRDEANFASAPNLVAFAIGFLIMVATAFLV